MYNLKKDIQNLEFVGLPEFEIGQFYLYVQRQNVPPLKVKYIGQFPSKKNKNKKKHLFIEVESKERVLISTKSWRARNFVKTL